MNEAYKQPTAFYKTTLAYLVSLVLLTACGSEEADEQASAPLSAATATPTQAADPIAMGTEAMTEATYRRHVEILASDEFGGRAPGSPGEDLTLDYLVQHFKSLE